MTKRILLILLGLLSQACPSDGGLNMTERIPNGEQVTHKNIRSVTKGTHQWTSHGLAGQAVSGLAIDPRNPATIYAGTYGGVFKSTDGGAHWQAMNTGLNNLFVRALAIDPLNPATVYAGVGVFPMSFAPGGGVYKKHGRWRSLASRECRAE